MQKLSQLGGKTILITHTCTIKKKFAYQILKKLGLNVIVLNKEVADWLEPYVDHWIMADIMNHNECIQAVRRFQHEHPEVKIDGIMTFWEEAVLVSAHLSDIFHWRHIPYSIAKRARNKFLFRQFCAENGLPYPKHRILRSRADMDGLEGHMHYPLVVKPIYGSSSAFVVKIENRDELIKTYEYIKANVQTHEDSSEWEELEILAEEYIDGDEVDIDIVMQNGKLKFWSIADNYETSEPYFMETGYSNPSNLPAPEQQDLIRMAEETLEKLGVQNGVIHFEAKSTTKGPVPIEVNLRMGGDEIHASVKKVGGVDLVEHAALVACGIYVPVYPRIEPLRYFAAMSILPEYSGILVNLEINKEVRKDKNICELHFHKHTGDPVFAAPQGFEHLGWVAAVGDNPIDAQNNVQLGLDAIHYEVARFHTASLLGKTTQGSDRAALPVGKNIIMGAARIEKIRRTRKKDKKKLHIGIASNQFIGSADTFESHLAETSSQIASILSERGYQVTTFDFNQFPKVISELRRYSVDLMINACNRINNTSLLEPHVTALLDALRIPYSGSNMFTLGLCTDKIRFKKLLSYHEIPMPRWDYAYSMEDHIDPELEYPLIVKPSNKDYAFGLSNQSVVTNEKELRHQLDRMINGIGSPALVEEYIEGDEYEVSILGNGSQDRRVLPISRSSFAKLPKGYWHIHPYAAKWEEDPVYAESIRVQIPPRGVSEKLTTLMAEIALDVYGILDCHDYGRVEFRVDKDGNPYLIELNANPSLHAHHNLVKVAAKARLDQGDLLEEIINMVITRYQTRAPYYHLHSSDL